MKFTLKVVTVPICLLFVQFLAAQGTVAGTVQDGDFNAPLAFANVLVKNTTTGTSSDFDGKYKFNLDAGTYTLVFSFVGYETKEVSEIIVKPNQATTIDVTLSSNSLEAIVIKTTTKRNTENAVLNIQKKSVVLLDGLSAQSIKNSGASNLASAVKSVPGVSVQGGKYVFVRGLGDRYTKSILNGVDIPGLDPDRNTIQMDIFPANILDNIIVLKSASAEYPADFSGGLVNVVTKDFPAKAEYSIALGVGYNPNMHFNANYLASNTSTTDVFGFDNGYRNLPINRYQPIPGTFENRQLLNTLTNRFSKNLQAKQQVSGANFDIGFTLGNQFQIGVDKLGYQASLSYKNETSFFDNRIDGAYVKQFDDSAVNQLNATLVSRGAQGINNVILNALLGLTYKAEKSKYKVNFLHIQNGESKSGIFHQEISQDGVGGAFEPLLKNALEYTERSVSNLLLTGKHRLNDTGKPFDFEWKLSPTFSKVEDKNHRVTPFQQSETGAFFISPSASTFPIQLWRNLIEENWVGKIDFDKRLELFSKPAKVKFGGAFVYKFRDFSIDDYTFAISGNGAFIANGDANNLLATGNIWSPITGEGTHLVFGDQFNPIDAYEGEQIVGANYASLEFEFVDKLKTVLGLRTEFFKSYYTGQNNDTVFNSNLILDEFDVFPSANLIYAFSDKINIRTSYSRTTARPSFKELSVARIFDPITNRLFIGNIDLKPTYVNNLDLRFERFANKGQMFAVSGFYKRFKNPIEQSFFLQAPTQLTVDNLGSATVYGIEIEYRQRFGFVSKTLDNLKLNANMSFIKSELTMSDDEYASRQNAARIGEVIERQRNLQGQAPLLINLGFDYNYEDIGLKAGLFYNMQGKTLEVVGIGLTPDVYTQPFNSLDFTLNKAFGETKKSSVDFKITNILNEKRISEYTSFNAQNQVFTQIEPGVEFSLGYTYKF